jgi:hypothetical protein
MSKEVITCRAVAIDWASHFKFSESRDMLLLNPLHPIAFKIEENINRGEP